MSASARAEALLPVSEVAQLWRCSKNHVYDLVASGQLRSTQVARGRAKTRIPESALAEFIASNTRPAKERKS